MHVRDSMILCSMLYSIQVMIVESDCNKKHTIDNKVVEVLLWDDEEDYETQGRAQNQKPMPHNYVP